MPFCLLCQSSRLGTFWPVVVLAARIWSGVSLGTIVSRRCLARVPEGGYHSRHAAKTYIPRASGAHPPRSGYVYRLAPEMSCFRRMPTGPEAFWGIPGGSGRLPNVRTHLKKILRHTRPFSGACVKFCW